MPSPSSLVGTMNRSRLSYHTTMAASHERVKVPQLESIAEHPCIVTSEPSRKSKKKADRRKLKEAEAPVTPIAMPVPRSAKLTDVVAAMEKSSDATGTDSRPVGELEVFRLDKGKSKAREARSAATRAPITDGGAQPKMVQSDDSHSRDLLHQLMDPHADQAGILYMDILPTDIARISATQSLIVDVMVHPMIAQGDDTHWAKLVLRLLDSTEDQQDVLSELYFFPGKEPISDHEVAEWQQATDALLEQVNDLRKLVDKTPSLNFKEPSEKSFLDQGIDMGMFDLGRIFGTGKADEKMFGDRGPSRKEYLRGASKPGYWKAYVRKELAARRLRTIGGEHAAQFPIESSQDQSIMSPPRPRITSARSNSEDIWESDAVPTTKSDKNGVASAIPREPMSRIKRRG